MKTHRHTLVIQSASACYSPYMDRHSHTHVLYIVHVTIMGNTSLVIKALSKQLQHQQPHHKPVCTFPSIPTGER